MQRSHQKIANILFIAHAGALSCFARNNYNVWEQDEPNEVLSIDQHRGVANYRLTYPLQVNGEEVLGEAFVELSCVGDDLFKWMLIRHTFTVGTTIVEQSTYDKHGREKPKKVKA